MYQMVSDRQLMQRFTLIHDGSGQGWQTAYLAFHVSARLGALLQISLLDSGSDREMLSQSAAQLQTGGRAAGVSLETQIVTNFSMEDVIRKTGAINGLFLPNRLLPDENTAARLFGELSCHLWIVSDEPKTRRMAVLVENLPEDQGLIASALMLSQRMSETLTGLILAGKAPPAAQGSPEMDWMPLQDFSAPRIASVLDQLHVGLLCLSHLKFSLARKLGRTCVVYPKLANA